MGFGFSDLGRIILKNNGRRYAKHHAFDERRQRLTKFKQIRTFKATPKVLKRVKAKIQEQNTIENRIYTSILLATMFFVVYLLIK